jgi:hypothetical protein
LKGEPSSFCADGRAIPFSLPFDSGTMNSLISRRWANSVFSRAARVLLLSSAACAESIGSGILPRGTAVIFSMACSIIRLLRGP